jgi:hypothetical protein
VLYILWAGCNSSRSSQQPGTMGRSSEQLITTQGALFECLLCSSSWWHLRRGCPAPARNSCGRGAARPHRVYSSRQHFLHLSRHPDNILQAELPQLMRFTKNTGNPCAQVPERAEPAHSAWLRQTVDSSPHSARQSGATLSPAGVCVCYCIVVCSAHSYVMQKHRRQQAELPWLQPACWGACLEYHLGGVTSVLQVW